jgi:hypothetical protein
MVLRLRIGVRKVSGGGSVGSGASGQIQGKNIYPRLFLLFRRVRQGKLVSVMCWRTKFLWADQPLRSVLDGLAD